MENKITLYGASGHCKVIIDIIQKRGCTIASIIDDNPNVKSILGSAVVPSAEVEVDSLKNVIVAIGNNATRKKLVRQLGDSFATAIHPQATIAVYTKIGAGTVVMAGAIINPDVMIGEHCIVNTAATIDHDCVLADFVHLSPNASLAGGVKVEEGAHIGIGAIVIPEIKIGKWATIGAGAVIINDVPDYAVVVGNPGRIIKFNQNNE